MSYQLDHDFDFDIQSESDIEELIIQERNEGVRQLAEDMEGIAEINLNLSNIILEQRDDLDQAEQNIEKADINIENTNQNLQESETVTGRLRTWMTKGALVSTGVTGAGAVTGVFLSPIAGGIGIVLGIGGILFCVLQMK